MISSENQAYVTGLVWSVMYKYRDCNDNNNFGDYSDWSLRFDILNGNMGECDLHLRIITICHHHPKHSDINHLTDTALHEVAHALAGIHYSDTGRRMLHGHVWNKWCKIIGMK